MTTKPKITITPKEGKIQFDIRQGNQTRWFSVEEETARELYQKLGSVLNEQDDWVEREIAKLASFDQPTEVRLEKELLSHDEEMVRFLNRKNTQRNYPVRRSNGSDFYETERQHAPKIIREDLQQ